jgi:hypothetical protein
MNGFPSHGFIIHLGSSLRKFNPENEMSIAKAIHFLAGTRGISPINKRNKSKPLGSPRISVLCKEDPRDTSKALKHLP